MPSNLSGYYSDNRCSDVSLIDNYFRRISYLRLSVTDRCNLRCRYCMPAEGINFQSSEKILSWEEMSRLTKIFIDLGITKVRITGGEPFTRKGIFDFLKKIRSFSGLEELYVTTNGVGIAQFVPVLKEIGINGINLSLDTLNNHRFVELTRRDSLDQVLDFFSQILKYKIPLKINTVVKQGFNTAEIGSIARLAEKYPIEVRFIEEMPFLGKQTVLSSEWNSDRITRELESAFPGLIPVPQKNSTAKSFKITGFAGKVAVIAGNSRSFCSDCNRVRVTAAGQMKTCLYGDDGLDLRSMLRSSAQNSDIRAGIIKSIKTRTVDGFQAYAQRNIKSAESMAEIGG